MALWSRWLRLILTRLLHGGEDICCLAWVLAGSFCRSLALRSLFVFCLAVVHCQSATQRTSLSFDWIEQLPNYGHIARPRVTLRHAPEKGAGWAFGPPSMKLSFASCHCF